MRRISRNEFLKTAAAGVGGLLARRAVASPYGMPIGIQTYSVRNDLKQDFTGTLKKVGAIGYREMEVNGDYFGRRPEELKQLLADAGLRAPSAHYASPKDSDDWARNMEGAHKLGLEYMLTTSHNEWTKSLDGWKRTAEFFNGLAKQCKDAGLQFAYHNHNFEFRVYDGVVAYDELLRSTDKDLVKMEMDCFWTTFAGKDPVEYFHKHPGRFPLLHIKDLKAGYAPTTDGFKGNPFAEVSKGTINWKRIFTAAKEGGLKHFYVEQDMWDRPPMECARISFDYLKNLEV
ncbi:MAG: sugar phosphate isomerase/epimerase [Bryobacteraceae bacterium]